MVPHGSDTLPMQHLPSYGMAEYSGTLEDEIPVNIPTGIADHNTNTFPSVPQFYVINYKNLEEPTSLSNGKIHQI